MFREGTCPICHEKIQVPDDREKILCMYCGKEIRVSEALESKNEMDSSMYEENYRESLQGLQELIRGCCRPMQDFKRDIYAGIFDQFYASRRSTFRAIEYVYQYHQEPEKWLEEMTECLMDAVQEGLKKCKTRGKQNQQQLDYNFLVSVYLIPAVLKYGASFSEPFADCLIVRWNKAFQTSIGKARFEDIQGGFRRKLCYVTTVVCECLGKGADCYELRLLKDYRDQYMESTPEGHRMVEEYYDIAPTIVKRMEKQPDRRQIYEELYQDYLMPCIRYIEAEEYEACREKYQDMVFDLKKKYMN
ncbi:MAG: hypothetical protein KH452_10625 [Clostridiales bacterium]|nr:hypothetical protein [Clostridiales bacterium]